MKNKFGFLLIKPQLGENIGACARSMKNFGFDKLNIVSPKFTFPNYKILESCNHSFKLNNASKIVVKPDCNYEIEYDELNAKIYVSSIIVDNNFDMISKKFDEKVFNNSEFADQILTSESVSYTHLTLPTS